MDTAPSEISTLSLHDALPISTQFALLTSLMALPRSFLGAPSGWLAERLGWPGFFAASVLLGLPGLLLLPFLAFRERSEEHTSELQSQSNLVCRLLLEKKKYNI